MVRGRRQDPTAQPSRQLEISRAFRQRRAKDMQDLRDQVSELEQAAQRLREENAMLKEYNRSLLGQPRRASGVPCARCHELQTELDCIKFQARSIASSSGCCSTATPMTPPSTTTPTTAVAKASDSSCCKPATAASPVPLSRRPMSPACSQPPPPPQHFQATSPAYSQPPHLSVASSRSLSSMSPASSLSSPSSFMPPTGISSSMPASEMRYQLPHPQSMPGTDAPPAVHRLWEDSVRQSGGDPNKCCAGFFECDQNGQIIVESPPHVP